MSRYRILTTVPHTTSSIFAKLQDFLLKESDSEFIPLCINPCFEISYDQSSKMCTLSLFVRIFQLIFDLFNFLIFFMCFIPLWLNPSIFHQMIYRKSQSSNIRSLCSLIILFSYRLKEILLSIWSWFRSKVSLSNHHIDHFTCVQKQPHLCKDNHWWPSVSYQWTWLHFGGPCWLHFQLWVDILL